MFLLQLMSVGISMTEDKQLEWLPELPSPAVKEKALGVPTHQIY
jgi:hypothetical protein